jgi:hypothetical protein
MFSKTSSARSHYAPVLRTDRHERSLNLEFRETGRSGPGAEFGGDDDQRLRARARAMERSHLETEMHKGTKTTDAAVMWLARQRASLSLQSARRVQLVPGQA